MGSTLGTASRVDLAIRRAKVAALRGRRLLAWAAQPDIWRNPPLAPADDFPHLVYQQAVPLRRADADPTLDRGKAVNLAIAAPHFDGLALAPDRPLSFWRALGRPTRARGFQLGAEVRAGCIVPTLGGGLCLLSNAIFAAACHLGWQILERHGHTMRPASDAAGPAALDATIFWPFVDLRVAPREGHARLGVHIVDGELLVDVRASQPRRHVARMREQGRRLADGRLHNRIERVVTDGARVVVRDVVAVNRTRLLPVAEARRNCFTCGETDCHARPRILADGSR